jgi:hypothetical protein
MGSGSRRVEWERVTDEGGTHMTVSFFKIWDPIIGRTRLLTGPSTHESRTKQSGTDDEHIFTRDEFIHTDIFKSLTHYYTSSCLFLNQNLTLGINGYGFQRAWLVSSHLEHTIRWENNIWSDWINFFPLDISINHLLEWIWVRRLIQTHVQNNTHRTV